MNGLSIGERNILKNELLTVKEVAAYLRVSRITVWRWCQQGTIPAFQIGRNWRIRRDDLLNLEKTSDLPSAWSSLRSTVELKPASVSRPADSDPTNDGTS
jgi:PTS system nitrogen regulatory IIA component